MNTLTDYFKFTIIDRYFFIYNLVKSDPGHFVCSFDCTKHQHPFLYIKWFEYIETCLSFFWFLIYFSVIFLSLILSSKEEISIKKRKEVNINERQH